MRIARRIGAMVLVGVAAACAQQGPAPGPSAGDGAPRPGVDDATLGARVRTAAGLNVEVAGGVVRLSGTAASREQASRAVAAARQVRGVQAVKEDIRIRDASSTTGGSR
jgi:hyperosmotically inducible protein